MFLLYFNYNLIFNTKRSKVLYNQPQMNSEKSFKYTYIKKIFTYASMCIHEVVQTGFCKVKKHSEGGKSPT